MKMHNMSYRSTDFRLTRLFEAGILTKITEDEYQKLGEVKRRTQQAVEDVTSSVAEGDEKKEENDKLQPMSIKALQGGFFVLILGHCTAGQYSQPQLDLTRAKQDDF